MPLWTALLAWPLLGERLSLLRVASLLMAFAGLALLFGGHGVEASLAKLPGILWRWAARIGFALGTV